MKLFVQVATHHLLQKGNKNSPAHNWGRFVSKCDTPDPRLHKKHFRIEQIPQLVCKMTTRIVALLACFWGVLHIFTWNDKPLGVLFCRLQVLQGCISRRRPSRANPSTAKSAARERRRLGWDRAGGHQMWGNQLHMEVYPLVN